MCKNNRIVPKNGLSEYIKNEKCVTENATIAEMAFGQMFAHAIEGFIGVEYEDAPDEWEEAWDINEDWGISIARNLNELIIRNR